MGIPRPAAEKLGVDRQDPDLDGLLLGLIRRATGGCHEHAARTSPPQGNRQRKRVNDRWDQILYHTLHEPTCIGFIT